MMWSPQQDAALRAVDRWLRDRDQQVFRLFGYAGTGKTTLARHLTEGIDGEVLFAAFTGKAAHVMRAKGCAGATTIHRLIYRREREDERGKPLFVLDHDSRARRASLIVIDECSMVSERIGQDLLSFDAPILVLGDTAQLPPIEGCGYFTAGEPDAMLTEIHRQARDNPITRMATTVREGGRLAAGRYGDSSVTVGRIDELCAGVDQILVGRNRTRRANNSTQRSLRSLRGALPLAGDKLVCLRNDYDRGLLNGTLWRLLEASGSGEIISMRIDPEDGGDATTVVTHRKFFDGSAHELPRWERSQYSEFDFGYALTVHKAQGSQWGSVLLVDESACFRQDRARWLYTGITRAASRVTVIV